MIARLKHVALVILVAAALVVAFPFLVVWVVFAAVAITAAWLWGLWRKATSVRRFRAAWQRQGKDLLLVYSNSPNWQSYVEAKWLPRWGNRAVVLNWSERQQWLTARSPEAALFRAFAARREFNPLVIVVPDVGWRTVRVIRFWRAFRDYKHGKDAALRRAEADLDRILAIRTHQR